MNSRHEGVYKLDENTQSMPANLTPSSYGVYRSSSNDEYITSAAHTGLVHITKSDTVNHIISGQFTFTAANAKGDQVKITEGRFDIKS